MNDPANEREPEWKGLARMSLRLTLVAAILGLLLGLLFTLPAKLIDLDRKPRPKVVPRCVCPPIEREKKKTPEPKDGPRVRSGATGE